MKLYQYCCRMRPPAPGAIPKRNLNGVICDQICIAGTNRNYWGLVGYTKPLTEKEMEDYELDYVGTVEVEE